MDEREQSQYTIEELLERIDSNTIELSPEDKYNILQGDANAMFEVGNQFYDAAEFENAAEWYRVAAIANHPEAQIELGLMYYRGQGVPTKFVEAYYWYTKQLGNPIAQYYLGVMHENGDSAMYVNKARAWFECSAEGGVIEGQYMAGVMNAHQSYDPKFRPKAVRYLTMAARAGHEKAKTALKGMVLLLGDEEVNHYQTQEVPYLVKKPKKAVSDEYLVQLETKVIAHRLATDYTPSLEQAHKLSSVTKPKEEEEGATEGDVDDLDDYMLYFSEEERAEYTQLMKEKALQDIMIKDLEKELADFDDTAFELVYRQQENEKIRQRNRKMEELFYELAAAWKPKRSLEDDGNDPTNSKKARL